jgi:CRISPR-associated protein Csm4
MRTYRIDLAVPSGFISPWRADTLFGHLCWVAERYDGFKNFKGAAGLIDLFNSSGLPFILSDGFPAGLLPAPLTLKNLYQPKSREELNNTSYSQIKIAKKREYLSLPQFQAFQRGEVPDLSEEGKGFITAATLHNQVNRFSNTTGEQGSLFELDEYFAPGGRVQMYTKVLKGFEDDLRRLFELFVQGGYGAKKSTGKGACSLTGFAQCSDLDINDQQTAVNGFIALSHFVPAKGDPIDGTYKTMVKYGKLGEEKTFCGNPFKKPLVMLKPGSVFLTQFEKPWYGRLIKDIAYADQAVVQYAYAFTAPANFSSKSNPN